MTLTITAVDESSWMPQVRLQVDSSPAVSETLLVYRVHDDGTKYKVLSDQPPILAGGSWGGRDYHLPTNEQVTYIAQTDTQTSAATAPMFVSSDLTWMISASDPTLSFPVPIVLNLDSMVYDDPAEKSQALGSDRPVYRWSRKRSGPSSSFRVHCDTPEQASQVLALLKAGGPILLNMHQPEPIGWMWIQPSRPTMSSPKWSSGYRAWEFGFEQCEQPDLDVVSLWDFDSLTAGFADFNTAAAAYADFRSMGLDVRL